MMQITTEGEFSGQAQFQVFMNADQTGMARCFGIRNCAVVEGCTDASACNYDEDATGRRLVRDIARRGVCDATSLTSVAYADGDGGILAEGVCGGEGMTVTDNVLDECGVCGGDGIADGACDCDGNVLDECGVCGGDGIADGAM